MSEGSDDDESVTKSIYKENRRRHYAEGILITTIIGFVLIGQSGVSISTGGDGGVEMYLGGIIASVVTAIRIAGKIPNYRRTTALVNAVISGIVSVFSVLILGLLLLIPAVFVAFLPAAVLQFAFTGVSGIDLTLLIGSAIAFGTAAVITAAGVSIRLHDDEKTETRVKIISLLDTAEQCLDSATSNLTENDVQAAKKQLATAKGRLTQVEKQLEETNHSERDRYEQLQDRCESVAYSLESQETNRVLDRISDRFDECSSDLADGDLDTAQEHLSAAEQYLSEAEQATAITPGRYETLQNRHDSLATSIEEQKASQILERVSENLDECESALLDGNTNSARGSLSAAEQHLSEAERATATTLDQSGRLQSRYERLETIVGQLERFDSKITSIVELIDTAETYLDADELEAAQSQLTTAKQRLTQVENELDSSADNDTDSVSIVQSLKNTNHPAIEQLQASIAELEGRIKNKVSEKADNHTSSAEQQHQQALDYLTEGEFKSASESVTKGLNHCQHADEIADQFDYDSSDSVEEVCEALSSLDKQIELIATTVAELEEQQETIRRAIRSGEYDQAEAALDDFRDAISDLDGVDKTAQTVASFESEADDLEEEIAAHRASGRINGFLGSAGSLRKQAEQFYEEQSYDRAARRLESALGSLEQAQELNDRHGLERDETIVNEKKAIQSLLDTVSSKPSEELSDILHEAEKAIASGIDARNTGDISTAVERFSTALNQYEAASELVTEYDLDQQWEVQQRHSMVEEYLEITRESLDERQQEVRDDLRQCLDTVETGLHRAEQHIEVDDHVSARESLSEVRSHIDDAAQLLETGLASDQVSERYREISQREKALRDQLPEEQSEGYRAKDLVESLQILATKIGESPRPEFVNQYGDYPADVYLETFGSWPEAIAAANLDPVDEASRERRAYSHVEVLDALIELADDIGHPPSKSEMNQHGKMSASPIQSRFKDWETALEMAGVTEEDFEKDHGDSGTNDSSESEIDGTEEEPSDSVLDQIEQEIQAFDQD